MVTVLTRITSFFSIVFTVFAGTWITIFTKTNVFDTVSIFRRIRTPALSFSDFKMKSGVTSVNFTTNTAMFLTNLTNYPIFTDTLVFNTRCTVWKNLKLALIITSIHHARLFENIRLENLWFLCKFQVLPNCAMYKPSRLI